MPPDAEAAMIGVLLTLQFLCVAPEIAGPEPRPTLASAPAESLRLQPPNLDPGRLSAGTLLGETGAGAIGMVAADVVAAGAGLALAIPLALAFDNDDGGGAWVGLFAGGMTFIALDLLLSPLAAALATRLVDQEHAEERSLLPVLALAYGAKLLALAGMVGATALGAAMLGEIGGMLGFGAGLILNYVGVPAAISLAFHSQAPTPEVLQQDRSPMPWRTFEPVPPPPPPLPGASRTFVFPVLSANF